jgi:transcription initiation factor TFIIIB Brf1 subunit/transcription initiation factor TFIIB
MSLLKKSRILNFLKENQTQINSNRQKPQIQIQADILNETQIKKISNEIESIRNELNLVEEKHIKLDGIIERAKNEKINENCEVDKDYEETEMFCVTCGHTCSQKLVLKHMEKCFNKVLVYKSS